MKGVSSPVTLPPPIESVLISTTASPKTSELIPGIFDYESSVNFDSYLAALGVNYVLRKLAGLASPTVTISNTCQDAAHVSYLLLYNHESRACTFFAPQHDCEWTIRTDTIFKSHEVTFKLNEEKQDVTMDDRKVAFVIYQPKSNQWVEVQKDHENITTSITRDFYEDNMRVALLVNDVGAVSFFRRRKSPSSSVDFGSNLNYDDQA